MLRKKLLYIFSLSLVFVGVIAAEDYRSGEIRLEHILLNSETGLRLPKHVNPNPAETLNLLNDLCYRELIKAVPCKTVVGPIYVEEMLKYPYRRDDKQELLQRQNFIRALVDNPALKNRFDQLLTDAQRYEQEVIIFMSDFFKNERCPELAQLELLRKEESFQYPLRKYVNIDPLGRTISTPLSLVGTGLQAQAGRLCFGNLAIRIQEAYNASTKDELFAKMVDGFSQFGFGTFTTVAAMFGVYNVYRDYINAVEKRAKIHALNKLIEIAQELESLCEQHGITSQFRASDMHDPRALALLEELKHPRYKENEGSSFFMIPLVHTLSYSIYKNDKQLAPVFACLAEMDAYNAFASKIVDSYEKKNKFCLVNFIESDHPLIHAESFWSLLLKNPIANSLSEEKHILLTGPNAGGKSTTIRGILQNILLGQCFGVAAAQTFDMTMFDVIHSYLNVSDNILGGESRFKAEVLRAVSIYKKMDSLRPDQKYFFALDELFTGTSVEHGEKCAIAFVKRITSRHNVQCIYATHFEKLKAIGSNPKSGVVNYKVNTPIIGETGMLKYPFTISKGASPKEANVAEQIAKEAGLFDEGITPEQFIASAV